MVSQSVLYGLYLCRHGSLQPFQLSFLELALSYQGFLRLAILTPRPALPLALGHHIPVFFYPSCGLFLHL